MKKPILIVGVAIAAGLCFLLGVYFGKEQSQTAIASLEARLRSECLRSSSVDNLMANTMRSVMNSLRQNRGIEEAYRQLNDRIDVLLVHQTVEYREGIADTPPDKLTFQPYAGAWYQTVYDLRKDREQHPVSYQNSKWESQINSILDTECPVPIKRYSQPTKTSAAACIKQPSIHVLRCQPVIKTHPALSWTGPDDEHKVTGSYDELVLRDGATHFEVVLWKNKDEPVPVALDTNIVYTFRVMRHPDWDDSFFGAPGGTRPAGLLMGIELKGESIWTNTILPEVLKDARVLNMARKDIVE